MDLDQITAQLAAIAGQLTNLVQKQTEQDQILRYLGQKIEEPKPENENDVKSNRPIVDIFRIPDPIKSMPSFDGNRKQVTAWLKTAEETLRLFENLVPPTQFTMYVQAVKNKIEGKARDILCLAGDPETFLEIKQILLETLGDKQELTYYKSQLWANKQNENMSIHNFYTKTKEIVQNIKTLAKQKDIYNLSWQAINAFIEEDALAAFLSGLRKPYFGFAQAAKPKNVEEAYAFLCKFSCNESIANNAKKSTQINPQRFNQSNFQPKNSQPFSKQTSMKNYNIPNSNPRGKTGNTVTPMEVDLSMRSRNSSNKRIINNNELQEITAENEYDSRIQNEEDISCNFEINANFQEEQESDTED